MDGTTDLPIGTLISYAGDDYTSIDDRYLICNGAILQRADYQALFDIIGIKYGYTDYSNFALPTISYDDTISAIVYVAGARYPDSLYCECAVNTSETTFNFSVDHTRRYDGYEFYIDISNLNIQLVTVDVTLTKTDLTPASESPSATYLSIGFSNDTTMYYQDNGRTSIWTDTNYRKLFEFDGNDITYTEVFISNNNYKYFKISSLDSSTDHFLSQTTYLGFKANIILHFSPSFQFNVCTYNKYLKGNHSFPKDDSGINVVKHKVRQYIRSK